VATNILAYVKTNAGGDIGRKVAEALPGLVKK
jgi:hypothetical protein